MAAKRPALPHPCHREQDRPPPGGLRCGGALGWADGRANVLCVHCEALLPRVGDGTGLRIVPLQVQIAAVRAAIHSALLIEVGCETSRAWRAGRGAAAVDRDYVVPHAAELVLRCL